MKSLFKVSAIACALALVGCGGDIKITPTVNDNSTSTDNSVNNSNNTTGATTETVECASYQTDAGKVEGSFDGLDCLYNDSFASKNISITANLTFEELPEGGAHVFEDALLIGTDGRTDEGFVIPENGPTMTVKPGATLAFTSGEAIIRIARGAKIQAVGTAEKPVTFTSAFAYDRHDLEGKGAQYADWGGIIINGNGLTNQCTNAQRAADTCNVGSEGITSYFGGNDNEDSSGKIKWAKIWYAGSGPRVGGEGDDLNSLTLNAVGSGSLFDYLHIHQGFDDGIEFFGGASNIKHIVVTDTQDDAIDIDAGWKGNAQFLFIQHGTVTTRDGATAYMGNNGFETDGEKNGGADYSDVPASFPTIANVTVITTDGESVRDEDPSQAHKFDDAIINYVRRNFGSLIGEATAERIKHEIGSAYPGEELVEIEVRGRNLAEGVPRSFTLNSNEILEALQEPLTGIVSAIMVALEQSPPELAADISERGMILTGGGALLKDIDRLLMEETGIPVVVADDPLTCVARGGGKAIEMIDMHGGDLFSYE